LSYVRVEIAVRFKQPLQLGLESVNLEEYPVSYVGRAVWIELVVDIGLHLGEATLY